MIPVLREPPRQESPNELANEFLPMLASEVDVFNYEYFGLRVQDDSMRSEGVAKGDTVLVRRHLTDSGKYIDGNLRVVQQKECLRSRFGYCTASW